MAYNRDNTLALIASLLTVAILCPVARAQDAPEVIVELDREKIYEGEAVRYRVFLNHFDQTAKPDLSGFEDFDIQLLGVSRLSRRTSRVFHQGPLYEYALRPKRTGTLSIPAPMAKAGGREFKGEPVTLEVVPAEEQDVALLELTTSRDEVYPMQPFDVTLTAAVKPTPEPHAEVDPLSVQNPAVQLTIPWADDEQLTSGLSPNSPAERWLQPMLSDRGGFLVNGRPSNRSPFDIGFGGSVFRGSFGERSGAYLPPFDRVLKKDAKGRRHEYWVYKLQRTFFSEKVGELAFGPVTLKGVFGTRVDTRGRLEGEPIFAFAKPVAVHVKDAPTAGRPASYVGAVGIFEAGAELSPREAKVGDPMTLTLWLRGRGTLDSALAPKLEMIDQVAERFKVYEATEETRDDRRFFTYSIRPRSADTQEFPSVALSYFDFKTEKFVTLRTDPLAIKVAEADLMADDEIAMAAPKLRGGGNVEARAEGIFANVTDLRQLRDETVRPDRWFLGLGGLAGLFVAAALVAQRTQKLRGDSGLQRRRGAVSAAKRRLRQAGEELNAGRTRSGAELVSTALTGIVADAVDSADAGLTPNESGLALEQLGVETPLIQHFLNVLQTCDDARYAGEATSLAGLADEAEQTLDDLIRTLKSKKLLS
jgi:hypothetical protein